MAVALKPVLQQSREAGEELPGGPQVLCSSSPDLSLLLGPTFQSQHAFQPLEPKPGLTSSSGNRTDITGVPGTHTDGLPLTELPFCLGLKQLVSQMS